MKYPGGQTYTLIAAHPVRLRVSQLLNDSILLALSPIVLTTADLFKYELLTTLSVSNLQKMLATMTHISNLDMRVCIGLQGSPVQNTIYV